MIKLVAYRVSHKHMEGFTLNIPLDQLQQQQAFLMVHQSIAGLDIINRPYSVFSIQTSNEESRRK
jgi:hypothetical protein